MKVKNAATKYPLLRSNLRLVLLNNGWGCRTKAFRAQYAALLDAPHYQSKSGRVKRWRMDVVVPKPQYCIIGTSSQDLRIVHETAVPKTAKARFTGCHQECAHVLTTAIAQWWQLPTGREIETTAAARIELPHS